MGILQNLLKNAGKAGKVLSVSAQLPGIIAEVKKLIGGGNINFDISPGKPGEDLTVKIIITDPSMELEDLAERFLVILGKVNITGLHVILDMQKNSQKLLKNFFK